MVAASVSRVHPHQCVDCHLRRAFCGLPEELRVQFENLKTSIALRKGETLFLEADPCRYVFFVCQGRMKLVTGSSEGKVLLLRFATPGDVLGLAEAIRGRTPYECSAVAAEPTIVAEIPADLFVRFVRSYPEASVRLTVALSEQYTFAQRETHFLAFGENSTARLARLLLEWSAEREGVVTTHVTHNDLAQSIGSTRETVTRILSHLAERGLVERSPDGIVIRNRETLADLAAY